MEYRIIENTKTCCVFGHWDINLNNDEKQKLYKIFEHYIVNKNVNVFYLGGFGYFDDLCHKTISNLKQKYPHIKRIYVCDDYRYISRPQKRPEWLKQEEYEEFIYFDIRYTGFYKRIYFRNCEIIKNSDYCVFYVDKNKEY